MRYLVVILLAAALILGQAAPSRAYTLQFTSTSATTQVKWPTSIIRVELSSSLNSPPPNIKAGSDVVGAARRALAHWSEASNLQFNIVTSEALAATNDGVNLITVSSVNSSRFTCPDPLTGVGGAQGRSRVDFDPASGNIMEADISISPLNCVPFSTDGTINTYDLEATFTHEIGHMLGLEHTGVVGATMQPRQGLNGLFGQPAQTMHTLSDDDRAGIRAIYGPRVGLGRIEGTVSFSPAVAAYGAHVWAEEVSTGRVEASNIALQNGAYRIDSLAPGQYRVVTEYLNEPVNAGEIASRSGAYQGIGQTPQFRTVEAGQVSVPSDGVATLNISVGGTPFLNPTFIGTNGQLSTIPVPIVPGRTINISLGGESIHTVTASGISVTSPFITVNQASVQLLFIQAPQGSVPVLNFDITVDSIAPPGDYSIRLVSNAGEVTYISGGLTIDLPFGVRSGNPIDDTQFFVAQHYRDFLNREPDASGFAFWTNQIESCGADLQCRELRRINVSAAFFLSAEFQETGFLVYRFHQAAFNTGEHLRLNKFLPDTQAVSRGVVIGQPGALAQLEANKQAFANDFVARPEFLALYPVTMANGQFIETLNANTGGSLSPAESESLINRLNSATINRAQALREVAEDAEFGAREKNRAFVLMQYFGYLRRNPPDAPEPTLDFQGFNFWLAKLNQFGGDFVKAEMVKSFIISGEYRSRFGAA